MCRGRGFRGGFLSPIGCRRWVGFLRVGGSSGRGWCEYRLNSAGGRVRDDAVIEGQRRLLNQTPLHYAGVLPARRDEVTVVIQEGHVGHMTTVGAVLMAGGLQTKTLLTELMTLTFRIVTPKPFYL